jgi:Flp pilus assembly protein TadD
MISNKSKSLLAAVCFAYLLSGCATTPQYGEELGPEEKQAKIAATLHLAESEFQSQKYPTALLRYEQVIELEPDNRQARLGAANSARELGNHDSAVEYFDMLLKKDEHDVDAMEGKAITLLGAGQYEKARTQLNAVVSYDDTRWRAFNALGVLADLESNYTLSFDYYQRALDLEPKNVLVMNNLGYSLIMSHEYAKAEEILAKGLAIEPGYFRIRNNLAIALSWQKKYQDALDVLVAKLPYDVAYNNIGYIAMLNEDYGNARYYFKKAISANTRFYVEAARNLERVEKKLEAMRRVGSFVD